jgi:diguanylate cyclase (GGDEF)-like protein/PAS domain S-box-containing protein
LSEILLLKDLYISAEGKGLMPPRIDLDALLTQLMGNAGMLSVFDTSGQVLYRVGSGDLLGLRAELQGAADSGGKHVPLMELLLPGDRSRFIAELMRLANGEMDRLDMRAHAHHADGSLRTFDILVDDGRHIDGVNGLILRAVDVTDEAGEEAEELERVSTLTFYRDLSDRLAGASTRQLIEAVSSTVVEVASWCAADQAVLQVRGPNGRGTRWTWVRGTAIQITTLHSDEPVRFNALAGDDAVEIPVETLTPLTIGENQQRLLSTQLFASGSAVAVEAGEDWGNGMQTRLCYGWQHDSPTETERASREIPAILRILHPPISRMAADVVANAQSKRFETIFHQLSDVVVVWTQSGQITYATPSFAKLLGRSEAEVLEMSLDDLVVGGTNLLKDIRALERGQATGVQHLQIRTVAQVRTAETVTVNLTADPFVGGFVTTGRDVTERLAELARQSRRDELALVVAEISSRFVNGTAATTNLNLRRSLSDLQSYTKVDRVLLWQLTDTGQLRVTQEHSSDGVRLADFIPSLSLDQTRSLLPRLEMGMVEVCVHDGDGSDFIAAIEADSATRLGASMVVGLRTADGLIGLLTLSSIIGPFGEISALPAMVSSDTSAAMRTVGELLSSVLARSASQQALTHSATHDSLTGLANRRLLLERCDRMLRTAPRRNNGVGLLFLDLDDFKVVNDTLGHEAGDELLIEVASRLRRLAQGSTVVARLGGDEFILLIEASLPAESLRLLAAKVVEALTIPFRVRGRQLSLKTSIGLVVAEGGASEVTPSDLVRRADIAMYAAKVRGGSSIEQFSERMEEQTRRRFNLNDELREAIEQDQLELFFQPQVDFTSHKISGCEALVRWRHPEKGVILPSEFIEVAEQSGLINRLGMWVFTRAARVLADWMASGLVTKDFTVAVNVSAVQLVNDELVEQFTYIRDTFGLAPDQLKIELTESTLAERDRVIPNLEALRIAGFHMSIDDFGTGYSSLSYLRDLPLHELKIDRSFVQSIEEQPKDAEMVRALITMAHGLGLSVVAEGIETTGQRDLLSAMGCNTGQGWLFAKALPCDEVAVLLQSQIDGRLVSH